VKEVDGKIETVDKKTEKVNEKIESLTTDVAYLKGLHGNQTVRLAPYEETRAVVNDYKMKEYSAESPVMEANIIGKDIDGKEYSLNDVIGKKVLLSYIENGQEVYFWGQFNEKGQWDGNCLLNVYTGGNLVIITDALYDDGMLQEYEQVVPDKIGHELVWIFSDRKKSDNGEFNLGETLNYSRDADYGQKFEFENVSEEDIIDVEAIRDEIDVMGSKLKAYYCGNTSNGKYNDGTGEAYLIKYDENEKIRTLYQGRFKDGRLEDGTGTAWEIARNPEEDTGYTYYKGKFSQNRSLEKPLEINLTMERINELISGKDFNTEYLKWYE